MPAAAPPAAPAFAPLYLQIKALLEKSLETREWRPGEAIPSEIELARRYRVSQGTVRKAIDALAKDNLVVRRQGKGTFVAPVWGCPLPRWRTCRSLERSSYSTQPTSTR